MLSVVTMLQNLAFQLHHFSTFVLCHSLWPSLVCIYNNFECKEFFHFTVPCFTSSILNSECSPEDKYSFTLTLCILTTYKLDLTLKPHCPPLSPFSHLQELTEAAWNSHTWKQTASNQYTVFKEGHSRQKEIFTCRRHCWPYIHGRSRSSRVCVYWSIIHFLLIPNSLCEDTVSTGLSQMLTMIIEKVTEWVILISFTKHVNNQKGSFLILKA